VGIPAALLLSVAALFDCSASLRYPVQALGKNVLGRIATVGNNHALKLVILGLTLVGFAMTLTIASLVWLMADVDSALHNTLGRGGGELIVVALAVIAGLGGLVVAYDGAMRRD
jgi:hypothetical protein